MFPVSPFSTDKPDAKAAKPAAPPPPSAWKGFWATLSHFDRAKMAPHLAFRNTMGVVLALAAGAAFHQLLAGSIVATGALNVSYSDDSGPYRHRARRMVLSSLVGAFAALVGSLTGGLHVLAVVIVSVWAFTAGLLVALGTSAADLGTISLVVLVVFGAKPLPPEQAAGSASLLLLGGLLQTMLALAFWPVRRLEPEQRALAGLYRELVTIVHEPASARTAPLGSANVTQVQIALSGLARGHEEERFRALLHEAERIRLSLLALQRLAKRLEREAGDRAEEGAEWLHGVLPTVEQVLSAISVALETGKRNPSTIGWLQEIQHAVDQARQQGPEELREPVLPIAREIWRQVDALAGQLRAAVQLTRETTPEGAAAAVEREERQPWRVRWRGVLATLRANLTLRSAACRHALRLAVCVALADTIGRSWNLQRSYWLPMTAAIVLKPDFTSTISRGILRLAGTCTGLLLATAIYHVVPVTAGVQLALLGGLMFLLRWLGPANYGVFVTALSALIVVLFSLTGVAPQEVIAARGLNTIIGGVMALAAYFVWPTWERTQVGEMLAQMLDAYRSYCRAVGEAYSQGGAAAMTGGVLDSVRVAARLARSNAEASADRLSAEPGISPQELEAVRGMLAHSNRFIHAVMAIEAGLWGNVPVPACLSPWRAFVNDVDLTLYFLADALRRPDKPLHELPDLRADQRALACASEEHEPDALLQMESDRVTDSLNTLREQIVRWAEAKA